jgi:hypothetical protein
LGKFWSALDWKILIYFMVIWNILRSFGIFYGHLEYFVVIWNILWSFGIFYGDLEFFYGYLGFFNGHLEYFTDIRDTLNMTNLSFCVNLEHFVRF